jgi:Transposase DDE domain group 1
MKNTNKHADESVPQTVTDFIKLSTGRESIQIGFTDQKVSGHAGLATFAGFLHWHRFGRELASWLPHRRTSPNALAAADLAMGFVAGILAGATKLAQVAYLRRDVLLAPLLAIERIGSQSSFSRFFQGFTGAGANLRCFGAAWHWCLDRLPSRGGGYTLDLDSTQLLHEDGQQEGVRAGHTPRGIKNCLHPLLGVLAEVKLVAGFWLRPGNTVSDNNVVAFTSELLSRLPSHVRLRLVRADSGFCHGPWLDFLESQHLDYIVVARLYRPVQRLLKKDLIWEPSEVPGTEVAQVMHQEESWRTARRLILIRHRLEEKERPTGKRLVDCPDYGYQALVTSLPHTVRPIAIWRDYNGRAGSENVIKELDEHFGLPQLCLKKIWSTEAALSLAVLSYNLCVLFQRHLSWFDRITAGTLRFRLFTTGGILSRTGGITTIRLSVPESQRPWWRALFEKLTSPFPNCNAISQWPDPVHNHWG